MRGIQPLDGLEKEAKSLIEATLEYGGGLIPKAASQRLSSWEVSELAQNLPGKMRK